MSGNIKAQAKIPRDHVELVQVLLMDMLIDIDELILRNQQAMRRSGVVVDVLTPSTERLAELRRSVTAAQGELSALWHDGQAVRWQLSGQ